MHQLLAENLDKIEEICRHHDVEQLQAFGSITSNHFTDQSDIDFLVKFNDIPVERYTDNFFNVHHLLESVIKRKIDLMTENSLSNPYFIKKVKESRELIYER